MPVILSPVKTFISQLYERISVRTLLLFGLFLRLIIMPFTGHWDLSSMHAVGARFAEHGIAGFYDGTYTYAIYPPLVYLFFGLYQKLISPFLLGDFAYWLDLDKLPLYLNPHVFRYMFLLKVPLLAFDLGILYVLKKLVDQHREKLLAVLWLFNPVTLYMVYGWGPQDIMPTFFVVLAVYLLSVKRYPWAYLSLGTGIAFKIFPIILVPILFVLTPVKMRKRMLYGVLSLVPLGLSIMPVRSLSRFWEQVFFSTQSQIVLHGEIHIGSGHFMFLFLVAYVAMLLGLYHYRDGARHYVWKAFIILFLLLYGLSAFTPPWFVWITPFLAIWWLQGKRRVREMIVLLVVAYFGLVLYYDPPINVGVLAPLDPNLYELSTPMILLDRFQADLSVRGFGMIRSIISGITAFMIWLAVREVDDATT